MEIVEIHIDNIDDLFSKFDCNDISDELAIYIEKRCTRVLKNEMLIKIISKNKIDNDIKDKIVSAIRSHFGLEAKYIMLDTQKRKNINIICFFTGILILILKNLLNFSNTFFDILDILGCFIIWESAFNMLFTDSELDMKVDRSKKIIKSHIDFELEKDLKEN